MVLRFKVFWGSSSFVGCLGMALRARDILGFMARAA